MTEKRPSVNILSQPLWHQSLAKLVDEIGTSSFMTTWEETVQLLTGFAYTVTFAYDASNTPLCLHHTFPKRQYSIHVTDYQMGPFFLDPLYKAAIDEMPAGVYRLAEVAPDQFYKSEYYKSYYIQTGPVDEIALFIEGNANWSIVTSLMRPKEAPTFSARDLKLLRCAGPLLCSISAAHWRSDPRLEITKPAPAQNQILRQTIENALQRLEIPALTPRETEIVGLVLQGHSSESIATILNISSGTVRIHRKNVYAKMRISSQRELFSAFMSFQDSRG